MQLTQKNNKTGLSKIVLAGNPNVGKSVIFNKLTNSYAEVSNYPGSTVEISKAVVNDFEIIDSPGIYGIGEFNEEETIAKNIIIKADKVINVVSALSLERDLFLTYQLIDLGIPFIVALNQTDEAQKRGICIDINKLEEMLGVKIFPTVAVKNQGIDALKKAIGLNIESPKNCTPELAEIIKNSGQNRIPEVLAFENNPENTEKIYTDRRKTINEIVKNCVSESSRHLSISEKIGRALLNPVFGLSSSLFVLYFLYKFIGVFVAGDIVDFLENSVILKYYTPWITGIVENTINSHIIKNFTVGEFGILTMSVQYIVGVLIPLIFAFNFFMAILEDSGYHHASASATLIFGKHLIAE
jgi:ferrous iron transport protein B